MWVNDHPFWMLIKEPPVHLRLRPLIHADQFCENVSETDNVKAPSPRTSLQVSKHKLSRRLCCCKWAEAKPALRQKQHCSKQFHSDKRCWKSPQEGKRRWFCVGCAIRQRKLLLCSEWHLNYHDRYIVKGQPFNPSQWYRTKAINKENHESYQSNFIQMASTTTCEMDSVNPCRSLNWEMGCTETGWSSSDAFFCF